MLVLLISRTISALYRERYLSWGVRLSVGQVAHGGVVRSPPETEYVAMREGVKEAMFAGEALSFMFAQLSGSCVRVCQDNQGGIPLAENPLSSARSKHIDVRYRFVGELATSYEEDRHSVPSIGRAARGYFAKSLSVAPFKYHSRFLLSLPLEGEYRVSVFFD